jgi:hypothetical protein
MLADTPASLQRLIARANRVSLPRRCSPAERLARLRAALCHQRTVRVTFFSLDATLQAAVRDLASRRGGIAPDDLARQYGPIRPWRELLADRRPRSTSERLVLLGWLLPRPPAPQHPPRFLVPPEVRAWVPPPLNLLTCGRVMDAPLPLAVRATAALILAATEEPLVVRTDGRLRQVTLQRLTPRLEPLCRAETAELTTFLLPLVRALGLLEVHHGLGYPTPAASRFLARPLAEQQQRLQQTWLGAPVVDAWLRPLLLTTHGISWPVLRRRLCSWAAALPAAAWVTLDGLHDALAAALGPLADPHTHGYRTVNRVPWQPRRAALIWEAALRGPLHWLGLVAWSTEESNLVARVATLERIIPSDLPGNFLLPGEEDAAAPAGDISIVSALCSPSAWQYGDPGTIIVPHTALQARVLRLLPFATWQAADATTSTYRITRTSLAAAIGQGWSDTVLWELLEQQAGPVPAGWDAEVRELTSRVRLVPGPVLLADDPAVLDRAAQARSVRRYLTPRLAPGIALVPADRIDALVRTLQRQAIICTYPGDVAPPVLPRIAVPDPTARRRARPLWELTAAECASLLLASAFYRQHAPPEAPAGPHTELEARLWAALPPALRAGTAAARDDLASPSGEPTPTNSAVPSNRAAEQNSTGAGQQHGVVGAPALDPLPPGCRVHVQFADGTTTITLPNGKVLTQREPVSVTTPTDAREVWNGHAREEAVSSAPPRSEPAAWERPNDNTGTQNGDTPAEPVPSVSSRSEPAAWEPSGAALSGQMGHASEEPAPSAPYPSEYVAWGPPGDHDDDATDMTRSSPAPPLQAGLLDTLRVAIIRRHTLEITYVTGNRGTVTTRLVRPLSLECHGETWYMQAYCALRRAERVFRLDRIQTLHHVGGRPPRGDPEARRWQTDLAAARARFPDPVLHPPLAPPPVCTLPPPGGGTWLDERL